MEASCKFSIIVVCLNPGDKLNRTLDSILQQTYPDYEVIVKDGGSKDGSIQNMPQNEKIRLYTEKDGSIYQAMNQAVAYANGEYVLFLNCGDFFYNETVLERTAAVIDAAGDLQQNVQGDASGANGNGQKTRDIPAIYYGDTYGEKNQVMITCAPEITGFTCYRNIPCHQSCFYATELCRRKPYNPDYRIRADYDHFLWCFYEAGARMVYLGFPVATYEGGGYSESKENRKRDLEEHRQITSTYMSKGELRKYKFIMACTLAPMRRFLAENKVFSGMYHKIKQFLYR